ncbi:hypothetical protein BJV82DRAFT_636516, partial [Fennellomyces sp. T-0311]
MSSFAGNKQGRDAFLKVFKDADDAAQDAAEADPFPAYLDDQDETSKSLAPFCPTSARRVLKALTMANVHDNDGVLDLGSGDGRFCTAAVSAFRAKRALGIESEGHLIELSRQLAIRVPSETKPEFIQGDLLSFPALVRDPVWSVIVVFLLPDHTDKFADLLVDHYRRGARIVSLVFNLNEIPELRLVQADEPDGIYVYSKP